MSRMKRRLFRAPKLALGSLAVAIAAAVCGCRTIGYYAQAVRGECQIVARQQRIEKVLADPQTPEALKARLQLVQQLRAFAGKELKLPVDGHYLRYADLHREFVVWNVYAAPEFSLEPKTWWYPFVGSLDYRGYFAERAARNYAAAIAKKGFDVHVEGVEAYSTLGWLKDPVLNTFINHSDAGLAEIIFHELGHQRVFAHGDTDFNEAFATVVGEEGARRWLRAKGDTAALEQYQAALRRNAQFVRLVAAARQELEALYGDERMPGGEIKAAKKPRSVAPETLRQEKQRILDGLRRNYGMLAATRRGPAADEGWLTGSANNAQLNSLATYFDLVPAFERLLAASGGDLEQFYVAAERLAKLPRAERYRELEARAP